MPLWREGGKDATISQCLVSRVRHLTNRDLSSERCVAAGGWRLPTRTVVLCDTIMVKAGSTIFGIFELAGNNCVTSSQFIRWVGFLPWLDRRV